MSGKLEIVLVLLVITVVLNYERKLNVCWFLPPSVFPFLCFLFLVTPAAIVLVCTLAPWFVPLYTAAPLVLTAQPVAGVP